MISMEGEVIRVMGDEIKSEWKALWITNNEIAQFETHRMIYDLDIRMAFGKGEVLLKPSNLQLGYIQVEWLLS